VGALRCQLFSKNLDLRFGPPPLSPLAGRVVGRDAFLGIIRSEEIHGAERRKSPTTEALVNTSPGTQEEVVHQVLADVGIFNHNRDLRTDVFPIPDSSRSFGELNAPAARMTSFSAIAVKAPEVEVEYWKPIASTFSDEPELCSSRIFPTVYPVRTWRFSRLCTGFQYAVAAYLRVAVVGSILDNGMKTPEPPPSRGSVAIDSPNFLKVSSYAASMGPSLGLEMKSECFPILLLSK